MKETFTKEEALRHNLNLIMENAKDLIRLVNAQIDFMEGEEVETKEQERTTLLGFYLAAKMVLEDEDVDVDGMLSAFAGPCAYLNSRWHKTFGVD